MARDVPTIDDSCDNCGASEADDVLVFDFVGDHLCGECADTSSEKDDDACCDNENRSFAGGCLSCGAPSL